MVLSITLTKLERNIKMKNYFSRLMIVAGVTFVSALGVNTELKADGKPTACCNCRMIVSGSVTDPNAQTAEKYAPCSEEQIKSEAKCIDICNAKYPGAAISIPKTPGTCVTRTNVKDPNADCCNETQTYSCLPPFTPEELALQVHYEELRTRVGAKVAPLVRWIYDHEKTEE